jgi:hypothetical protein
MRNTALNTQNIPWNNAKKSGKDATYKAIQIPHIFMIIKDSIFLINITIAVFVASNFILVGKARTN